MVSSLQRRYLELTIARQSAASADHAFNAGAAYGANEMLKRIDGITEQENTKALFKEHANGN